MIGWWRRDPFDSRAWFWLVCFYSRSMNGHCCKFSFGANVFAIIKQVEVGEVDLCAGDERLTTRLAELATAPRQPSTDLLGF